MESVNVLAGLVASVALLVQYGAQDVFQLRRRRDVDDVVVT